MIIIFLTASFSFSQLVNDFKVNDDSANTPQEHASLGIDGNGNFVVVWYDWRSSNEELKPGTYETFFDGSGLSSGIYFCRLIVNSE